MWFDRNQWNATFDNAKSVCMNLKVTQYCPSANNHKAEIWWRWDYGVCDKDFTPPHPMQLKLRKMIMWLDGHPLTDTNEVYFMK